MVVRESGPVECARLTVRDHGVGVPEGQREQVFDRFHRAHAAAGDAGFALGGLGLGLYVTKQIVERHGGTIACEAAEGQGSAFVVTLPLSRAARLGGVSPAAQAAG